MKKRQNTQVYNNYGNKLPKVTVNLSDELLFRLEYYCLENGVTKAQFIREAIEIRLALGYAMPKEE